MSLLVHYLQLVAVVGVCLAVGLYVFVGTERIRMFKSEFRARIRDSVPHLGFLGLVFVLSMYWRPIGGEVSWTVGFNITHTLYDLEGYLVPTLQSIETTEITWVLSIIYVWGYVFLLVFPLVAYLFLDSLRLFRVTTLAYIINYIVGLFSYTLFVAYGPRNYMPGETRGLMYEVWPEIETLTTHINANTNVFPSLHTSLAVTVAFLAWYSRDTYPNWVYVATALAVSIVFSTMYLGLHWGVDVVAGILLAAGSVWLASAIAPQADDDSYITRIGRSLFATAGQLVGRLRT